MDIAAALAFIRPEAYWGMTAQDIMNVYMYLERHRDIPQNPFKDWQRMRDKRLHPKWRYYVICTVFRSIKRIQNALEESLSPVHRQVDTSK